MTNFTNHPYIIRKGGYILPISQSKISRMKHTNKNKVNAIYIVILAMLFQVFAPTVFALTSETQQTGKFFTVCTMQGYQQVWVDLEDEQHDTNLVGSECLYCSLNISTLDAINLDITYYFNFLDEYAPSFTTLQNNIQSKTLFRFLAIRAPPLILS